jgi:hypothetical protein
MSKSTITILIEDFRMSEGQTFEEMSELMRLQQTNKEITLTEAADLKIPWVTSACQKGRTSTDKTVQSPESPTSE